MRFINRFSAVLAMLGAVVSATPPAAAQCAFEWQPGNGLPGVNGSVRAITVYDDGTGPALYVGGFFSVAGGVLAVNIARWDGGTWSPLGSGIDGIVKALTVYNGELIAGGDFTFAGATGAKNIARWDGSRWAPLGSGMEGAGTLRLITSLPWPYSTAGI